MKKPRRGKGEGSIFQRPDKKWVAEITIGTDNLGKRKKKTLYGKTKREVQGKLEKLKQDILSGINVDSNNITLSQFLVNWLEDARRPNIRPNTYIIYKRAIEATINPILGGLKLQSLTPMHVNNLYSRLEKQGRSGRFRQIIHTVLRRALVDAVKWNYIQRNVCDAAIKPKAPKKPMKTMTPEQVSTFLNAAKNDRYYALYLIAISTGMRQGEILALQWSDIDLKENTISVQYSLTKTPIGFERTEPKSRGSRRAVVISEKVKAALIKHKKRMLEEGTPGPWIFYNTEGRQLRKINLHPSFKSLLKTAGLPDFRFHDLRHTSATLMLKENVHAKVVQERLGHANISMTLDTYSHVLPSMQVEAANKLDKLFEAI